MSTLEADLDLVEAIMSAEDAEQVFLEAEGRRKKTREAVVNLMAMREQDATTVEAGKYGWKVKVIAAERTTIHDDLLIKAVGKRVYNALSERKASKDKVLAAIQDGRLDPALVKDAIEIKRNNPYPKIDAYMAEDNQ